MTNAHLKMSRSAATDRVSSVLPINGVKVFSATMQAYRIALGERITEWLAAHPAIHPIEIVVTQSSDADFHCLTITVFYWDDARKPAALA